MTDTKFTPGPWKPHATGRARSGKPEHEIHWSDDGECIAEIVHGEPEAHLIAAAPELYEALSELAYLMQGVIEGDYKPDSLTLQPAKAALAKARRKS